MELRPVILCGGEGTRLWPVSRRDCPKQFAPLIGEFSSFQQAAMRLSGLKEAGRPLIVTGAAHEEMVQSQLRAIGMEADILLEPEGRDSGPATAVAAAFLLGQDCVAIMQPADHYIPELTKFQDAALLAGAGAAAGYIVTFGVTPTFPQTAYGYICAGDAIAACPGVSAVRQFVEKPSHEKAVEYLKLGYAWNSGMFAFRPGIMLVEMERFEPAIAEAARQAVSLGQKRGNVVRLDETSFARATKKSLDHAVMERTEKAAVVPANFAWSDLGSWNAIYEAQTKDAQGNAVSGENVVMLESERCLVRARVPVALIGVSDIGVIAEPDSVVVCRLDASAGVKTAVDALRAKSRPEALRAFVAQEASGDYVDLRAASHALSQWLRNSALPLWWASGADHEHGGFFELLDERGDAMRAPRRLRVQARQTHVFALAEICGWPGPWKSAVRAGLDYLNAKFRRADGSYRTLVEFDGSQADDTALLYDQAFVLLALASAAKAGIDVAACTQEAAHLRAMLMEKFARGDGSFREKPIHGAALQSNPHMHLLEAALAWRELDGGWDGLADSLVKLCMTKFIDRQSGALREFFDADGAPVKDLPGRIVEPGHQFEWTFLLLRARPGDDEIRKTARSLFEIAEKHGVDPMRRVAIDSLLDDFSPHAKQARLWPQTERLRAAIALAAFAEGDARAACERTALAAAEGLTAYLRMKVPGLWRDRMRADGTFVNEPAPASSLYHIAGAVLELRNYVRNSHLS